MELLIPLTFLLSQLIVIFLCYRKSLGLNAG